MTDSDITSTGGPTVLLTGPTRGIGAAMLDALIVHPSHPSLILLAREPGALDAAVGRARAAGLGAHGIRVDLGDLESVTRATEEVRSLIGRGDAAPIDAAVLNAGTQFADRRHVSAQSWEQTFAVNVIAQHALLLGLAPALAPGAHTITLGSSTHRGRRASFGLVPDPVWRAPARMAAPEGPETPMRRPAGEREAGGRAYADSKLALVTLSHDWADRFGESGRRLNVYDPGLVPGTGLGRDLPAAMYWVWRRVMPAMSLLPGGSTPARSGRHAVALALGDQHPTLHNGYVEVDRVTRAEAVTFDAARRAELRAWLDPAVAPFASSR